MVRVSNCQIDQDTCDVEGLPRAAYAANCLEGTGCSQRLHGGDSKATGSGSASMICSVEVLTLRKPKCSTLASFPVDRMKIPCSSLWDFASFAVVRIQTMANGQVSTDQIRSKAPQVDLGSIAEPTFTNTASKSRGRQAVTFRWVGSAYV